MYPGLASLLQQLSADPGDELLASRIVALLLDIPDSEYKVDQLLAAAQMLLAVAPRLSLICSHWAFRAKPERLESLAIAEEALARMGRRAKVRVLREERRRLDLEAIKKPAVFETVSKLVLSGLDDAEEEEESGVDALEVNGDDPTILGQNLKDAAQLDSDKTILLDVVSDQDPDWWRQLHADAGLAADINDWQKLAKLSDDEMRDLVRRATAMARKLDEEVIREFDATNASDAKGRLLNILVVDAVHLIRPEVVQQKDDTIYELLARLIAWTDSDHESIVACVQNSIALRLGRLPTHASESLARLLRDKARAGGRPVPTFASTML